MRGLGKEALRQCVPIWLTAYAGNTAAWLALLTLGTSTAVEELFAYFVCKLMKLTHPIAADSTITHG